jgi:cytochrome oxidase assembly protein ShyY1
MIQKMVSRKWILVTVLVILGAALCVRLGIWQLDRLAQRRASNAHYVEMVSAPAVNLPTDAGLDLSTMEYRAINASGNYDFSRQIVLFNQYFRGQIGYHILTPLVFSNGTAVLVDRGWMMSRTLPVFRASSGSLARKRILPGRLTLHWPQVRPAAIYGFSLILRVSNNR